MYGFVLTEPNLSFDAPSGAEELAVDLRKVLPVDEYPYPIEMIEEKVIGRDYTYGSEFGYGLELVLDGLEDRLAQRREE